MVSIRMRVTWRVGQTEEVTAMVEVTKQLVARLEKEERSKVPSTEGRLTLQDLRSELRSLATTLQRFGPLAVSSIPLLLWRAT